MLKDKILSVLPFLFFILAGSSVNAQSSGNSEYSQYGIGDLSSPSFSRNLSMGGLSQAINNSNDINVNNPASYSAIDLTTFEAGFFSTFAKYRNSANTLPSTVTNNTSIGYLAFAFPVVAKKWGASFGILPFSTMGYSLTSTENTALGPVNYKWKGSGGLSQFYIGNAVNLFKGLSIGANVSYLFGPIDKTRTVQFAPSYNALNILTNSSTAIGGFYFNYGAIYTKEFKTDYAVSLGLSGSATTNLNANTETLSQTYIESNGTGYRVDTVLNTQTQKGTVVLPGYVAGGLVLRKTSKWMVGIDYHSQDWSRYRFYGLEDSLTNSSKIILGGEYIYKRVRYRAGLRLENTYLSINNTQLKEQAISIGAGIPISRGFSYLNISAEIAQRGTLTNSLIQEQYVRLVLGLTLSDRWFIKRKFD